MLFHFSNHTQTQEAISLGNYCTTNKTCSKVCFTLSWQRYYSEKNGQKIVNKYTFNSHWLDTLNYVEYTLYTVFKKKESIVFTEMQLWIKKVLANPTT